MKIKDLHGKIIGEFPDHCTVVFETPTGSLYACISQMGNNVLVCGDDGHEIRHKVKDYQTVFIDAVKPKGTPEDEDQLVGRYARAALTADQYDKIKKRVDYEHQSPAEVDRLIGALTRGKKTPNEFTKLVRNARGYFAVKGTS